MGAIAGIIHLEGAPPPRDQAQQLGHGLGHRGPDDKGRHAEDRAVFAHRRTRGSHKDPKEPHVTDDHVALIDGRPYNGGVEVIARRWKDSGTASIRDIDGPFALAVWDRHQESLVLARDVLGRRPLFYAQHGTKLAFSSEIGPLLGLPWVSRELAYNHLAEYLSFRYVHAPRTLLRDVHALPPGHLLRFDGRGVRTERWTRTEWAQPGEPVPDAVETERQIDGLLRRSVQKRLQGDLPRALLLSGGLDSSSILRHARELGENLPCYTVALSGERVDESSLAARVATVLDAEHHILRINDRDLVDAIPDATHAMGQPLPTAAGVLQLLLFRLIKPDARVVLSGDGGDEVLGGRGMARLAVLVRRSQAVGRLPGPMRGLVRRAAKKSGMHNLAATGDHFGRDRNVGGSRVFNSTERTALLRDPGLVRPGIRRTVLEPGYQDVIADPLNAVLAAWQRGWLPEDGLARSDRMASALGMEVRYPMLDDALRIAAARLPGHAKVRPLRTGGFETKAPLRAALRRVLPKQLVDRPKRSLPNPLDHWLRNSGSDYLSDVVEGLCEDPDGLFVPTYIRDLARTHREGRQNNGLQLWSLALLWEWKRQR